MPRTLLILFASLALVFLSALLVHVAFADNQTVSIQKLIGYTEQSQRLDGCIVETPWSNYVEPSYANLAADSMVLNKSPLMAKDWMNCYFGHMNTDGSVWAFYDFANGTTKSINSVDAKDSELSSFLTLVRDYYDNTKDLTYINSHMTQIIKIADTLYSQQQANGMTDSYIQRMEDNTAVFKGFNDIGWMLYQMGNVNYTKYSQAAFRVENGIETLYQNGSYVSYPGAPATNWNTYYPDAQENVLAISYDIPEVKARTVNLWNQFNLHQPNWKNSSSLFPDAVILPGPLCAKDFVTMNTFVSNFNKYYANTMWWGFNVGDMPGLMQVMDYQNGTLPSCMTNTSITGHITNQTSGLPLSNVRVGVYSYTLGKGLPPIFTDSNGKYTIPYVPAGGVAIMADIPYGMRNIIPGGNTPSVYYVGVNSTTQAVYNFVDSK